MCAADLGKRSGSKSQVVLASALEDDTHVLFSINFYGKLILSACYSGWRRDSPLKSFPVTQTDILVPQDTEQSPGVLRAFGHMEGGKRKWQNGDAGKDEGDQISCFILHKRKDPP